MRGSPIGRDSEFATISSFLGRDSTHRLLVLAGEPGIGKTTIWEAAADLARDHGYRQLTVRAAHTEAALPFAGLVDLVEAAEVLCPGLVAQLPAPQRRAVEVAVLRREPGGDPPEPLPLYAGVLALLQHLALHEPLLIAVDDAQWLDDTTALCLGYVSRRLDDTDVRLLFTRHPQPVTAVERALAREDVQLLPVQQLGSAELERLVIERLTWRPPRSVLRRITETAHGNPLFALGLAQLLHARATLVAPLDLPLPDSAQTLFGARVAALAPPQRRVLLALSLGGALSEAELDAAIEASAIDAALEDGLLVRDGARLRPVHPLLAAVVRTQSTQAQRRDVHGVLANAVSDRILRVRHLALAASQPDAALAEQVEDAARTVARRGAGAYALDLADHALRLTPAGDAKRGNRVLLLARCQITVGQTDRAVALLTDCIDTLSAGGTRARAHLMLGELGSYVEDARRVELSLAESQDDDVRALALGRKAMLDVVGQLHRLTESEPVAAEALRAARRVDNKAAQRTARSVLAWIRILRGEPVEGLGDGAEDLDSIAAPEDGTGQVFEESLRRPIGVRHAFRGETEAARAIFTELFQLAERRSQAASMLVLACQLTELEIRCGNIAAAQQWISGIRHLPGLQETELIQPRLAADLAALRGDAPEAITRAGEIIDDERSPGWERVAARKSLGLGYLAAGDNKAAARHLGWVWDYTAREGVDDPGAFPVAADLVEALVAIGDLRRASAVLTRLRELAERQRHPWALATTQRSEATLALTASYTEDVAEQLAAAAEEYGRLGLGFDRARTLLALGSLQRRADRRAAARRSLAAAADAFGALGCDGWSMIADRRARSVSGRRSANERGLSPSEARVAELAASGLSNRQIAQQLFVSVHTVEAHLSRVYTKLAIRSRAQLIHHLPTQ